MRRLIVHADDFGLTRGVSRGIAETIERGIVTATSAMVCMPGSLDALAEAKGAIDADIGVHLQLTGGRPVCPAHEVPSLVGPDGAFPRRLFDIRSVALAEVYREWHAQIAALRRIGVHPTHLNTHHGLHLMPPLLGVYLQLARECDLPVRAGPPPISLTVAERGTRSPSLSDADWTRGPATIQRLREVLSRAFRVVGGSGVVELVTHPGCVDDELLERSSYTDERAAEQRVLCSGGARALVDELEISLVGYRALVR